MKAYLAIKYHANHQNREVIEGISQALAINGVETICVTRDIEKWGKVELPANELMRYRTFSVWRL